MTIREKCISTTYQVAFCTPECHRAYVRYIAKNTTEDNQLETLYDRVIISAPQRHNLANYASLRTHARTRAQWLPETRALLSPKDLAIAEQFDKEEFVRHQHITIKK